VGAAAEVRVQRRKKTNRAEKCSLRIVSESF
jgi:hypothetical protein